MNTITVVWPEKNNDGQTDYGQRSLAMNLNSILILQTLIECLEWGKIYIMHVGRYKDEQSTALAF